MVHPVFQEKYIKKESLFRRGILLCMLFVNTCFIAVSQKPDYRVVFGDDWKNAETFVNENRSWMEAALKKNHIPYPVAIAVIFPELIRYSALRDKMEITLLKTLYVNLGERYSNFSVGRFQMKPSFAELVRRRYVTGFFRNRLPAFRGDSYYTDIKDFRKSVLADLEDTKKEFNYLVAFIHICEKSYGTDKMDNNYRLRFLATAYNYGIDKTKEQIISMMRAKYFSTKLFSSQNYSYADISLFWYRSYINENIISGD
ncbi:MAG TPA: hypothetical protein VJ963_08745 [Bacteroidales bacterium]|nr:hypothetical protein [Bacteroidales bacterium]